MKRYVFVLVFFSFLFGAQSRAQARNYWEECELYYYNGDVTNFDMERSRVLRQDVLALLPWKPLPQKKEFALFLSQSAVSGLYQSEPNNNEHTINGRGLPSIIWIKIILPERSIRDPVLYISSMKHKIQLFANGRMLYEFGDIHSDKFEGSPYHIIRLWRSLSREIYIRLRLTDKNSKAFDRPLYTSIEEIVRFQLINNAIQLSFVLLFIVMGLILCVFFLFSPRTRYFLFQGLSSIFIAMIVALRGEILYLFSDNYIVLFYLRCWALYLFVVFMELFVSRFFKDPRSFVVKHFWIFHCLLVAVISVLDLFGVLSIEDGYTLFAISLFPSIVAFTLFLLDKFRNKQERMIILGILIFLFLSTCSLFAELTPLSMPYSLTDMGYMAFIVSFFLSGVKKIIHSRDSLELGNEKLNRAYERLFVVNQRNMIIIDNSMDLFFSMDDSFHLISINAPGKRYIRGFEEGKTVITDLLYHEEGTAGDRSAGILLGQLHVLMEKGSPVILKTSFKNIWTSEPEELSLRFELITITNGKEILCCGKRAVEDNLNKYFICEKQHFAIHNHLILAEELSYRVTRNMIRYVTQRELTLVRIAVRELIANAIEHGNLGVTFEEKTLYGKNQIEYLAFLNDRKIKKPYSDRTVSVQSIIDQNEAKFVITDEGDGFDFNKALVFDSNQINGEAYNHGRGLRIANEVFDRLDFSNAGRTVAAIRYLREDR